MKKGFLYTKNKQAFPLAALLVVFALALILFSFYNGEVETPQKDAPIPATLEMESPTPPPPTPSPTPPPKPAVTKPITKQKKADESLSVLEIMEREKAKAQEKEGTPTAAPTAETDGWKKGNTPEVEREEAPKVEPTATPQAAQPEQKLAPTPPPKLPDLRVVYQSDLQKKEEQAQKTPTSAAQKTAPQDSQGVVTPRKDEAPATPEASEQAPEGFSALPAYVAHFGFDKSRLHGQQASQLKDRFNKDSEVLGKISQDTRIRVVGHTCSRGPKAYNQGLSERRAQGVAETVAALTGMPLEYIEVVGMGEERPAADNATLAGRRNNRRVEIFISIAAPPMLPELRISRTEQTLASPPPSEMEAAPSQDEITPIEQSPEEPASSAPEPIVAPQPVKSLHPAPEPFFTGYFTTDDAWLNTARLDALMRALTSLDASVTTLRIEGHTDSTGAPSYNAMLSEFRAEYVAWEIKKQFGAKRFHIITTGYGDSRPVASNATPAGRRLNRRAALFVQQE